MFKTFKQGFTLIELSIVILIIALLMGAISVGASLIKTAKLRTIINEYNYYQQAIFNFNHQYGYFPGDLPNASSIWSNCDSTGGSNSSYCNGNGDGYVEITTSAGGKGPFGADATIPAEGKMAWRHLSLANFVKGQFDGVTSATWSVNTANTYPYSTVTGLIWAFDDCNTYSASVYTSGNGGVGNSLSLIGYNFAGGNLNFNSGLLPADAYNIDNKIDDGLPSNGFVASSYTYQQSGNSPTSCTANDTAAASVTNSYAVTGKTPSCNLYFYFNGGN